MTPDPQEALNPQADPAQMIRGDRYRFTLISRRILRLEYDPSGVFEDRPTQTILNRQLEQAPFRKYETDTTLEIDTELFTLYYTKGPFSPHHLYIDAHNRYTNYGARWRFGENCYGDPPRHHNLYGTARTLDKLDGACALDFGLIDRSGHSLLDDSAGMVRVRDGSMLPRRGGVIDLYYFACGHDYTETLREFYRLTGAPPLLPRWAMGNWWSRYYAYTADSYQALLDRFSAEELPFTVAILDMDWHITNVPPRYGRGWTGYTWNKALFPDPPAFLQSLHSQGYHCAVNLHPADGVQPYEAQYAAAATRMGIDPATQRPIAFDCTSPRFMTAYFEDVLRPLEKNGIDFFWIDWQQGKYSVQEGLDPLWMLNHMHFEDSRKGGKRGMILSRYAGFGSHRCPVGFSGDTVASWESLRFQPYFTATAANAGYSWWSHDIGGFKAGIRDRELYIRWLQFGVFSPILRMHCSDNPFSSKEPWSYDRETARRAGDLLRLRHRLIPYFYTMNYLANSKLQAAVYPIYHDYPDAEAAYHVPNQYFFGTELMVCAVTERCALSTGLASVNAWIPPGLWTDMQTGKAYQGPRKAVLCRSLDQVAVLAKPGAIVPLDGRAHLDNSTDNPEAMELMIFPGASNSFALYEDAGDGMEYRHGAYALTHIGWEWGENQAVLTLKTEGDRALLPPQRAWRILLRGMTADTIDANCAFEQTADAGTRTVALSLASSSHDDITVRLGNLRLYGEEDREERVFEFLHGAQISIPLKKKIFDVYKNAPDMPGKVSGLHAMHLEKPLMDALLEIIL